MARVYDIAVAAVALGVERKWLDNLTAQHDIPGTEHLARGVARRLAMRTLVSAAIVRDLNRDLRVPVARAVQVASTVLGERGLGPTSAMATSREESGAAVGSPAVLPVGESAALSIDIGRLESEIERRLLDAMETVVPRRRGRPPRKERRGTR
jgi:hypothetical protein